MVKKDKKSKVADQKARVAAKKAKQAAQKEKKLKGKSNEDSDMEDVDIESVLEEFAKQQTLYLKVTESACEPPPPRTSSTLIGSPSSHNELFLFGGEHFNGALATFYNDLFIYLIDRGEWRKVTCPNCPLPRSGHAWCRGGNAGGIYLFGGEFSSPKQGTFYHYNDFWHLDPSAREWTRLESKGKGPPARSGHRMTYYKNYILLFGGFQDTSQQTKYLQDLWIYDCQKYVWHNPEIPPASQKPEPRSSFSFLPHDAGAVLYGGYSRVKAAATTSGKKNKSSVQAARSVVKPIVHQDTWFLRIYPPSTEVNSISAPTIRWERRKKPSNLPNPPRAGATMVYHKGRGISFGGVHDVEATEDGIDSEFFDNLFAWNVERNRFFSLSLRQPRAPNKKQPMPHRSNARRGREQADGEELLQNLAALERLAPSGSLDAMIIDSSLEISVSTSYPEKKLMSMPHPRFNAQLAVQEDVLFIFGGTFEQGEREYTFDDMFAIDLGKLDGVKEIFRRALENWHGSEDEESDSDSQPEDDTSEDEDMDEESSQGVLIPRDKSFMMSKDLVGNGTEDPGRKDDVQADFMVDDSKPHPRPFENLRDFYNRTSNEWQEAVVRESLQGDFSEDKSIKEIRKKAFDLAEIKWWDCREEIRALEDQQEEAGIGEIVSIKDRAPEAGGAGWRR